VEVGHSISRGASEEGLSEESSSRPALFEENHPGKPRVRSGCYILILTLRRGHDRYRQ
jgi:hypothetical protein